MSKKRIVLIVDAYSSGKYLPARFKELESGCIHIKSSDALPSFYLKSAEKNEFLKEITYNGNFSELIKSIGDLTPDIVLPGTESGVSLADEIAEHYKCAGNGLRKSLARRNKYLMGEALREQGGDAVMQGLCSSYENALDWAKKCNQLPLVVKPIDSAGSDGFSLVNNLDELKAAVDKIVLKSNFWGKDNNSFLIQECLQGDEYMVNTVSWQKHHVVTDIWRAQKRISGQTKTYDYEDLIDPQSKEFSVLSEYIEKVLNALDISYGPAHSEVMLTQRGPVLIETGARLCGGLPFTVGRACHGISQLDLTVAAYSGGVSEFEKTYANLSKQLLCNSKCVTLLAPFSGRVVRSPDFSPLQKLESFHSLSSNLEIGSEFSKTVDLASSPGLVFLVHPKAEQVLKDYEAIRTLELGDLYSFVEKTD